MKPPSWSEGPSDEADKDGVVRAAIAEVLGDPAPAAPLVLLIPDPPGPVDQESLSRRSSCFQWGPRGFGLATADLDVVRDLLWELFQSRCDQVTIVAIAGAAELAGATAELARLATVLMTRPTPSDAAGGRPFVGLTYDWGEPIRRFDPTGETLWV